MDNATAEYTFVTTFFSPDTNPIPVRNEASMSPSIVQSSMSPAVPDDETGTPAGTLSAATSTSLVLTPVTTDPNSNPAPLYSVARGATPQPNQPVQLSKEDQAALVVVWKQITDPAVEYTQVGVLLYGIYSNLNFSHGNGMPCLLPPPGELRIRPSSPHAWSRFPRSFHC